MEIRQNPVAKPVILAHATKSDHHLVLEVLWMASWVMAKEIIGGEDSEQDGEPVITSSYTKLSLYLSCCHSFMVSSPII
jgi:hypothetical protein